MWGYHCQHQHFAVHKLCGCVSRCLLAAWDCTGDSNVLHQLMSSLSFSDSCTHAWKYYKLQQLILLFSKNHAEMCFLRVPVIPPGGCGLMEARDIAPKTCRTLEPQTCWVWMWTTLSDGWRGCSSCPSSFYSVPLIQSSGPMVSSYSRSDTDARLCPTKVCKKLPGRRAPQGLAVDFSHPASLRSALLGHAAVFWEADSLTDE